MKIKHKGKNLGRVGIWSDAVTSMYAVVTQCKQTTIQGMSTEQNSITNTIGGAELATKAAAVIHSHIAT
eukprot:scaffold174660_cov15-Tisochrysis_lutea.AAC.1